jgi:hypothetical protein
VRVVPKEKEGKKTKNKKKPVEKKSEKLFDTYPS